MGAAIADAILQHRTEQQLSQLKQAWSTQPQRQPVFTDFKVKQNTYICWSRFYTRK